MPPELLAKHPHLIDTPRRMTDWLLQYSQPKGPLSDVITVFEEASTSIVVEYDIPFSAICAHHFLPFTGKAAVGYIPNGRILGLSKLARVVHYYAERITLQEHITQGIVEGLEQEINPEFVGAYLYDVQHGCMTIRGVQLPDARTDTFDMRGDKQFIDQFMRMVQRPH